MAFPSCPVVCDLGSYQVRSGLADDVKPCYTQRSCLVTSPLQAATVATFGAGATLSHAASCTVQPSLWSAPEPQSLETVLRSALRRPVCRAPEDQSVFAIIPDSHLDNPASRVALAQTLLESLRVPSLFFARATLCQSLEAGQPTAIVVDAGHEATTIRVIADGYVLKRAGGIHTELGGKAVTAALRQALESRAKAQSPNADMFAHTAQGLCLGSHAAAPPSDSFANFAVDSLVDEVKRVACEVSPTLPSKRRVAGAAPDVNASNTDVTYEAPDGSRITINGTDRTSCYDNVLFASDSHMAQRIVTTKSNVVQHAELQARAPLLLSGGMATVKGLPDRLHAELKVLDKTFAQQQLAVSRDGTLAAWRGGALICAAKPFESMWISRARWMEEGDSCLTAAVN